MSETIGVRKTNEPRQLTMSELVTVAGGGLLARLNLEQTNPNAATTVDEFGLSAFGDVVDVTNQF
jgi:hypothetical protein